MATTKKRLNITLLPEVESAVRRSAQRDKMAKATKASQLLQIALETEEEIIWDKIAATRDNKKAKFIPHKKAWK
ncbi:MAG: hypothetical protein COT67_00365 [Candidatus Tagabacteria bacterium CG09_land_8_20_14_0_10_41_14]|uniref:CopG family transcriptional regulator n=2 Tax=Candidatus Tagaibacteriota TaxID=1817918 RepID=A0A2H0WM48_9BACT|nr:MAG: hypothetical protein COT67_00365 [Candidatus Tagabacteria bacterium CG09_land_8_20_14_0_10_41_14]PJE72825.1 MAG: hypothetical protein COV00_03280 [Candidatus Tagabacteria bacterium CG10_big_fil_rev_8_21_14_0_10_40_13]